VAGGPFIINKIDKTAKTITVKRNDKCWGLKPKLQAITFIVLDVSGQAKAFQSDQIDCFDIGPDPAAYKQAQAVAGAEVRKAGGPNFRHIDLGQKGPMSDLQSASGGHAQPGPGERRRGHAHFTGLAGHDDGQPHLDQQPGLRRPDRG
jgi:hypothetical protein